jgi:hypothetical protein
MMLIVPSPQSMAHQSQQSAVKTSEKSKTKGKTNGESGRKVYASPSNGKQNRD